MKKAFDHIGIPTTEPQPGESWVEETHVWVTSPRAHPYNVEWLRFEADSPVTGPLRTQPHVAYRVTDVHDAVEGHTVLAEPFDAVAFDRRTQRDGIYYAAFSQVAADLLTSPGRGPSEAEELIRWMERHEDDWRA